jgi:hypothetical protein
MQMRRLKNGGLGRHPSDPASVSIVKRIKAHASEKTRKIQNLFSAPPTPRTGKVRVGGRRDDDFSSVIKG